MTNHTSHIKNLKSRSAFTMAELIIVMGILVVLFAIGINAYRNQRYQADFNNSLVEVLDTMKTARSYASTSRADSSGSVPVNGYGVLIDQNTKTLTLFSNNGSDPSRHDVADEEEETYTLPERTNFLLLYGDGGVTGTNKAVIIFEPPFADVSISNNSTPVITEFIELSMQFSRAGAPSAIKTIKINKISGFPEIEL